MYPLHVVPELLQVLDVSVADLADDKVPLAPLAGLARLHGARLVPSRRAGGRAALPGPVLAGVVPAGQRGDGDARAVALAATSLAQAL